MMKRNGVATILAWAAHALAWVAGLWFVFGPVYQGVSVMATLPGEPAGETARHTVTLLEANGLWVLWLLLVPILLSGVALLVIVFTRNGQARHSTLLWTPTLALLVFCVVGILSIGLFYVPAALALLVAAITRLPEEHPRDRAEEVRLGRPERPAVILIPPLTF